MSREIVPYIQAALATAYPGLRFHVKSGRKEGYIRLNGGGQKILRSVIVEYDRGGVLGFGGTESSMRRIVREVLDNPPVAGNTIQAVSFEKHVTVQERKRLNFEARVAATTGFWEHIKQMQATGASDREVIEQLVAFQDHELNF